MIDQYGYTFIHPATLEDQQLEMERYFTKRGEEPGYVDCGCCGGWHPRGYQGDCRNDLYRIDDPDELHGSGGWEALDA